MIRELVLWLMLTAVAYRGTRLVVRDTLPPVLWLRDRLAGGWRPMTEKERLRTDGDDWPIQKINEVDNRYVYRWARSPDWLAELITCPWCASAYVSGALVAVTDLSVGVQWPWLMGGAVWATSALLTSRTWA